MLDIGRVQILTIDHIDHRGAWLRAGDTQVLLPARQVPEGSRPGSDVSVFCICMPASPWRPSAGLWPRSGNSPC